MKIGSVTNNPSFGKIIIDGKPKTKSQKATIKNILRDKNLSEALVKKLEKLDTDIYITPKSYGDTVILNLYTDINFFGKKIIPCDGRYNSSMITYLYPGLSGQFITNLKISNFLKRAGELDLGSDKNIKIMCDAITN